jgi:hypothetical protein
MDGVDGHNAHENRRKPKTGAQKVSAGRWNRETEKHDPPRNYRTQIQLEQE